MRTGTLALELARRGHRILWWTSAFDHLRRRWLFHRDGPFVLTDRISGYALRGCGYRSATSVRRLADHRLVAWKFRRAATRLAPPHVAVVSMPPHDLAAAAVGHAWKRGVPTVLDLRDPWPESFLDLVPRSLRSPAKLMLASEFRLLAGAIRKAESVVATTSTLLAWGLRRGQRPARTADRVFYTGARRVVPRFPSPRIANLTGALRGKFLAAFVGTFGFYHSPSVMIEAARRLRAGDIHFVLAGAGDAYDRLHRAAAGLPNVHFPGWLGEAECAELLAAAHVGLCVATRPTEILPNKAVAYLRAGLPIISSFQGDLRDLIETRAIGFHVPPNDAGAVVECLRTLRRDPVARAGMARRAAALYDELFVAEALVRDYADHVETVAASGYTY